MIKYRSGPLSMSWLMYWLKYGRFSNGSRIEFFFASSPVFSYVLLGQAYFDPSFGYYFFVGEIGRVGLLFDKWWVFVF